MKVFQIIAWIVITAIVVFFIAMNFDGRVPVKFWPLGNGDHLLVEWPVGIIALVFFLFGFLPTWAVNRAIRWRLQRRIGSLENTARANTVPVPAPPAPPVGAASLDPAPRDPAAPEPAPLDPEAQSRL